jgi:hypothetical protein
MVEHDQHVLRLLIRPVHSAIELDGANRTSRLPAAPQHGDRDID